MKNVRSVKNKDANKIRHDDLILQRWKEYFFNLLNAIQEDAEDKKEVFTLNDNLSLYEIAIILEGGIGTSAKKSLWYS